MTRDEFMRALDQDIDIDNFYALADGCPMLHVASPRPGDSPIIATGPDGSQSLLVWSISMEAWVAKGLSGIVHAKYRNEQIDSWLDEGRISWVRVTP